MSGVILSLSLVLLIFASAAYAQSGNVGIGESQPGSKGSIKGNLSVGSTYSSASAPIDGAIIEGKTGIGVASPDGSAKLQIDATDAGILIPRMTGAQRDAIASPATGLLVYVTDGAKGFWYYNGTAWAQAIGPKGDKGDKGNDGPAGAQGPQGIQGAQGNPGAAGAKGDKGDKGNDGAQGPQGIQGQQGTKGDKGDPGTQGLKGDKGDKGDAGTNGAQGVKGDTGAAGAKGATGATGFLQNGTAVGQTPYWNGSAWVIDQNIYNNGGNIGIGTASPGAYKLNVFGNALVGETAARHNLEIASKEWPELYFTTPTYSKDMRIGMAHQADASYGAANGDLYVYSPGTNRMDLIVQRAGGISLVNKGGNVGIGTTNPTLSKLQIEGAGDYDATLRLKNTGTSGADAFFVASNSGWSFGANKLGIGFGTPASANVKMTIQGSDGNVGIGTTAPGQKLEVNGNIKLDDNMMVEGNTSYRVYRNLASYSSGSGGAAGAFVINTSQPWNSACMFRVKVEGYFYDASSPFETTIGGYMYTGNDFYNKGYINVGAKNLSVRFARNSSTNTVAIILGDEGSSYAYPKLTVTSFMQGHSGINEAYADGWSISQITSLTGYDYTTTVPNVTTLPSGSGNYIQNGTGSQSANYNITGVGQVATLRLANGFELQQGISNYGQFNSWVHLNGYYGLYSSYNGAHFFPNDGTYGGWKILGSRNGYGGINYNSKTVLMMQDDLIGLYNEAYGRWIMYGYGSDGSTYITPNGGSVSMGASTPISSLDLSSNTSSPMFLKSTTAESDIEYQVPSGVWQVGTNAGGNGTSGNQFYVYGNGTGYVATFQKGTGYVGIGTTSPSSYLDVAQGGGVAGNGTYRSVFGWYVGSEPVIGTNTNMWGYCGTPNESLYRMYSYGYVTVSDRDKKQNIHSLNNTDLNALMKDIENMELAFYDYKGTDKTFNTERPTKYTPLPRLGTFTDAAPDYVLDNSLSGVNLYDYASLSLAGVKNLNNRVKKIEENERQSQEIGSFSIKKGETKRVEFKVLINSNKELPIVNITIIGEDGDARVIAKDHLGFTVKSDGNLVVDWMASLPQQNAIQKENDNTLSIKTKLTSSERENIKQIWKEMKTTSSVPASQHVD